MENSTLRVFKMKGFAARLRRLLLRAVIGSKAFAAIDADPEKILDLPERTWLRLGRHCETVNEVLNAWGLDWTQFCDKCGAPIGIRPCKACEPEQFKVVDEEIRQYTIDLHRRAREALGR